MKTTTYDEQAEKFLADNSIKFRATLSDSKPVPWGDDSRPRHHYRVTLSKVVHNEAGRVSYSRQMLNKRLVFDFWASIHDAAAGIHMVTLYDVLSCISSDANCPETFEDFCSDYGYEQDSIKALQMFRRCAGFAKRLRAFFTEAELEHLKEIQ